jgi:hypothetical protein
VQGELLWCYRFCDGGFAKKLVAARCANEVSPLWEWLPAFVAKAASAE